MTSDPIPDLGPWPALGYVDSPLDRAANRRGEAEALAARPDARTYLWGGELVAAQRRGAALDPLFDAAAVAALGGGMPLFLGLSDGAPRFAARFDPARREEMEAAGFFVSDLRSTAVAGLFGPEHLGPLACGKALGTWHLRHRFCANCGTETRIIEGGWRRDCTACGAQHFPRTDPVVIMLSSRGARCLLGRQAHFAPGMWSALAGFVEPGETVEEAVRRELLEESGIETGAVSYLASQPWPFPMSLMIGCQAEALGDDIVVDRSELEDARWFDRSEVALMLARTHPEGLFTPPPVAIAHHLIRAFVAGAHPPAGARRERA
ncbi:NAD(+) diphosphatase [Aquabacter spiritensis]|uniref:NAD(+) diphosphatase n=1 Tax=Aquabacter spiritensis TaxID=933073 RepID=A0A4R3M323_9HYPH|nr:NAD(+) diphosphatase [Aquabacter spiritensis]TCT06629.1 NAD+ diphosphatase [Aquabacter spiritensis]